MSKKMRETVRLIENIAFVVLGITNGIAGVSLWSYRRFFTVSLLVLSLMFILRGVSELLDIFNGAER